MNITTASPKTKPTCMHLRRSRSLQNSRYVISGCALAKHLPSQSWRGTESTVGKVDSPTHLLQARPNETNFSGQKARPNGCVKRSCKTTLFFRHVGYDRDCRGEIHNMFTATSIVHRLEGVGGVRTTPLTRGRIRAV
ncbi:hypothetical protein ABW19_dt0206250 [Dactylella cylindrospora]|nr:hypothetical protein ABW19_dt0206250 [Dactylella cylindrospora]